VIRGLSERWASRADVGAPEPAEEGA
jgi:hypothetical protein